MRSSREPFARRPLVVVQPGVSAADAAAWDRLAARYARQEHLEHHAIDALIRLAAPAPHERVVDLATGTGLVLRRLAATARPPAEAVGVDHSRGMLARAGPLPAGWRTLQADVRDTGLPAGFADVVTCAYLLHLLEPAQRRAALVEMRRLMRAQGHARIAVATVHAGRRAIAAALAAAASLRPAAWQALRPLDPTRDLHEAGLTITRRAVLPRHGYPSLVLVAEPAARPAMPVNAT